MQKLMLFFEISDPKLLKTNSQNQSHQKLCWPVNYLSSIHCLYILIIDFYIHKFNKLYLRCINYWLTANQDLIDAWCHGYSLYKYHCLTSVRSWLFILFQLCICSTKLKQQNLEWYIYYNNSFDARLSYFFFL